VKNPDEFIQSLSPHLFWDVNQLNVDADKNKQFVIERVLEYGFTVDWKAALKFYGAENIVSAAKNARYLETNAMHFVSKVFNVNLEEFRCYKFKQSTQNFWPG